MSSGKLSPEAISIVLEALESRGKLLIALRAVKCSLVVCVGNIEWQDKQKSRCLVMWRSPQEWGQLILKWVCIILHNTEMEAEMHA